LNPKLALSLPKLAQTLDTNPKFAFLQVRQLFGAKYSVELLMREDRMPIEDVWKKRGCTWFNEATYIITKRA
jgi:hypothetical protein